MRAFFVFQQKKKKKMDILEIYVVGTQYTCLSEGLLMSTHNMFLCKYRKSVYLLPHFSGVYFEYS